MATALWVRTSSGTWKNTKSGKILKGVNSNPNNDPTHTPGAKGVAGSATAEKKPAYTPTEEEKQHAAANSILGPDAEGAKALGESMFSKGSLGRMDETGQYARSPEEVAALAKYQEILAQKLNTGRSTEMQGVLDKFKAGLDGYTAEENTALREQQQQEGDRNFATNKMALMKAQARSGVRGGAGTAQMAQLLGGRQASRDDQEQKLMIANVDEKQKRLTNYGSTLRGAETDEFGRSRDESQRQLLAQQGYSDMLSSTLDRTQKDKQFDMGQAAAEKAGYSDTMFGALGVAESRRARESQDKYNREYLNVARAMANRR